VDQPAEENPFLGWRGIRMCLDVPELFKPQLRALLRAAVHGNLKIMFPMIVDNVELRGAKKILEECRQELESEGKEFGELEVGIMVETPAAAIRAADIAPEVSFFSIGTNDLVQYTLAADRGNERLTRLQSADHPAVLDLIGKTCDPAMAPKLVELGVTELSMSAPSIPRAKKVISEL
jgi:phosphoenolpyruvate-protein kinase (PTS system EI component)